MKKFEIPEILIRKFEVEDVVTTSGSDYETEEDELPPVIIPQMKINLEF